MKSVASEAELQGLLTPALRTVAVLESLGLLTGEWGGLHYEAKLVVDLGKRAKLTGGPEGAGGGSGRALGALRRPVVCFDSRGDVKAVELLDVVPWELSGAKLGYSRIELGQRGSLKRAGYGLSEGVKPLSYKISDSAIGFKPYDGFVSWSNWVGYALGWSGGGVVRCYLVPWAVVEGWLNGKRRGSIGEGDAWAACVGALVW
jgi:hypothetical protein